MRACCECGVMYEPTGKGGRCLPCRLAYDRAWRARRKAEGRPVTSTKMSREYHRVYEAEYLADPANRARRAEQMRGYAKAHATREHHRARWQVQRALRSGKLIRQACEACGAEKTHAHHDDYAKPLDVRWLCRKHHIEHHAKAEAA